MGGNPYVNSGNPNQADSVHHDEPRFLQLLPRMVAAINLDGNTVLYPESSTSIYGTPEQLAAP
jgi:hypothetical protein